MIESHGSTGWCLVNRRLPVQIRSPAPEDWTEIAGPQGISVLPSRRYQIFWFPSPSLSPSADRTCGTFRLNGTHCRFARSLEARWLSERSEWTRVHVRGIQEGRSSRARSSMRSWISTPSGRISGSRAISAWPWRFGRAFFAAARCAATWILTCSIATPNA